jgi:SAM-dependent methyltransferase
MADTGFWDRVADRYAARPVGDEAAYAATLDRVRHWMRPDMAVLELGCGTGTTAAALAPAVHRLLGTDLSEGMLRVARKRADGLPDLTFEQAGALEAGVGRQFDMVMAFNLLHLLENRAAVLTAVRARLVAGGVFVSKTPCLGGKPWLRPVIAVLRLFDKVPPGIGFLRPARLEAEIAAAGFEIVETGDYPKSLPNHFVVARAI